MSDHDDDLAPPRERIRDRIRENADELPVELNVLDGEDGRFVERPTQSAETVHLYDKVTGDQPPVDGISLPTDDVDSEGFFEKPTWEVAADDEPGLLDDGGL